MTRGTAIFRVTIALVVSTLCIGYWLGKRAHTPETDEIAGYRQIAKDASRNASEALRLVQKRRRS